MPSSENATLSWPPSGRGLEQAKGVGRQADPLFRGINMLAGSLVLLILAGMVTSTTLVALPIFREAGLSFFTSTDWQPTAGNYGALGFIYGTLVTSAIALLIGVPLSMGVALFLTEVAPRRLRGPLSYIVDLLAMVPSVVYGLWGILFLLPYFLQPTTEFLNRFLGFVPLFGGPVAGLSYFGAGVVLAVMIIPIVSSLSREVFSAVPIDDRYAAYALGATRWEMIRGAVLSRGRPGLVGAVMLGMGRALGETIAVALLVGSRNAISASILKPGYSMAAVIANTFQEATGDGIAALVAIGVVLFVITIIVNIAARALVWRFVQ